MAKNIFFISVGCVGLTYTARKIYETFNGGFPNVFSFAGYAKSIFGTQNKLPDFIEYDVGFEKSNDFDSGDSGSVAPKCDPDTTQSIDLNMAQDPNAGPSEAQCTDDSSDTNIRPELSRRSQAIKTAMILKSKRWLREQTRKDSECVVFHSATNYRYAKKFGLNAKLAPPQNRRR